MPEGYQHLTQEERYQIGALLKSGLSCTKIAQGIGVHRSTVYREIKRNRSPRVYRPDCAHKIARARHQLAMPSRRHKISGDVQTQEEVWLCEQQWNPDEISCPLKREYTIRVSHELIYQHIWRDKRAGGKPYLHLRRRGKKYQKRGAKYAGLGYIPGHADIKERPAIVAEKGHIGDWEGDLIEGEGDNAFLFTLVERKTQFTVIKKIPNKEAPGGQGSLDADFYFATRIFLKINIFPRIVTAFS